LGQLRITGNRRESEGTDGELEPGTPKGPGKNLHSFELRASLGLQNHFGHIRLVLLLFGVRGLQNQQSLVVSQVQDDGLQPYDPGGGDVVHTTHPLHRTQEALSIVGDPNGIGPNHPPPCEAKELDDGAVDGKNRRKELLGSDKAVAEAGKGQEG